MDNLNIQITTIDSINSINSELTDKFKWEEGYNTETYPKYGRIYNWAVTTDTRKLTSSDDWVIGELYNPNRGYNKLLTYAGADIGFDWISNDAPTKLLMNGTNQYGFNGIYNPTRNYIGDFQFFDSFMVFSPISSDNPSDRNVGKFVSISINSENISSISRGDTFQLCLPLRIVKEETSLINGQSGTYTGNDGTIYPTICIGTQEWLACNLGESKFRNGDIIPNVTDNSQWVETLSSEMCAYNNDENTVHGVSVDFIDNIHIQPRDNKRINGNIIDNLPIPDLSGKENIGVAQTLSNGKENIGVAQNLFNGVDQSKWETPPSTTVNHGVGYGRLYNSIAAMNPLLAPSGYHLPSTTEIQTLVDFTSTNHIPSETEIELAKNDITFVYNKFLDLLEVGTRHWPYGVGTDKYGFKALGAGSSYLNYINPHNGPLPSDSLALATSNNKFYIISDEADYNFNQAIYNNNYNHYTSVRFIKNDNIYNGDVTDLDGNIYNSVIIGTQIWLKQNWACTKLTNGTNLQTNFNSQFFNGNLSTVVNVDDSQSIINNNPYPSSVYDIETIIDTTHIQPKSNKKISINIIDDFISGSFYQNVTNSSGVTITINKTLYNNNYSVNITPTSLTSAIHFYITNKNNTTFYVAFSSTITGIISFDWILKQ